MIGDVRGKGLLMGVELVGNKLSKESATEEAKEIVEKAYKKGLLLATAGIYQNVLKITPQLVLKHALAEKVIEILDDILSEVKNNQ